MEMDINTEFRTKRKITWKRQFDEGPGDSLNHIQRSYFLFLLLIKLLLHLIPGLNNTKSIKKTFGFLFTSDRLRSLIDMSLKDAYLKLEVALKHEKKDSVDWRQ
jgi:hypothetical protein